MVKHISERLAGVIITIEDPIEFVFSNARGIIKQREVGNDTRSFAEALRHALRQDPDVILVGELRDTETISAAITAAETGHLVLGTLHTIDAPKAIDRIVDAFSPEQQPQIIAQLANALAAIVSQRLLPSESGGKRVLATEVLVANTAVRATIRERRWEQIVGLIEIGAKDGMRTFDESLSELYLGRQISKEEAIANARDKTRFESLLRAQTDKKRGLIW
jgi:twitching motility protein PilT